MKKHLPILTKTLTLLMIMLVITAMQAAPVSRTTARQAAYNFLLDKGVNMSGINALTDVSARVNMPNLYIFDCAGVGGYAIVAADNRVKPILHYSLQDNFPQTVTSDMQGLLARYDRIVSDAKRNNITPSPEVTNQWQELMRNGSKDGDILPTYIWGEGAPFNVRCPFDRSGEQYHCKVGSLAVALASLIYYYYDYLDWTGQYDSQTGRPLYYNPYKFPFFHGTKTYTDATYGTLSADFSGKVIPNNYLYRDYYGPSSDYSTDSVAKFLANVAIAIHTNFGPYQSTANLDSALAAMAYHFGYDTTTTSSGTTGTTTNYDPMRIYTLPNSTLDLDSILTSELDSKHPVLCEAVSLNNSSNIHYFLCDGYMILDNTLYHLNWGDENDTLSEQVQSFSTYFSTPQGEFYYPDTNSRYRLTRIICNLKPKENWFHTDKDVLDLPWSGSDASNFYDCYNKSIHLYGSSATSTSMLFGCNGGSQRHISPTDNCGNVEMGGYGDALTFILPIGADTTNSSDSVFQCFFRDNGNVASFKIRQQPRNPYDTIIHDNGVFDHAVNNQSSRPQKWGIRIPRSEFDGLGTLKGFMAYLPTPGNYSISVYLYQNDSTFPQIDPGTGDFARQGRLSNHSRVCRSNNDCGWFSATNLSWPIRNNEDYLWIAIKAQGIDSSTIGGWASVCSQVGTGEYWYMDANDTWLQMPSDYSWMIRPIFLNNSCTRPTNFIVNNWDDDGIYPEWDGPRNAAFEIEMGPHNFTHGDSTAIIFRYDPNNNDDEPFAGDNEDTTSLTRHYEWQLRDSDDETLVLEPNTQYDFYIRTVCDETRNVYSPWVALAEPVQIDCVPYSIPFFEDFMEGFPLCWEEESMSGILEWLMNSGYWRNYMRMPGSLFPINPQPQPSDNILPTSGAPADSAMLITPELDLTGTITPVLTFVQRQTSYVSTDTNIITIYYRTDYYAPWTLLMHDYIYSYDIDTVMVRLPNPSESYQLAFEIPTDGVMGAVFGSVAVIDTTPRNITKSIVPANSGTVAGDGYYMLGDRATLVANPATGYHFHYWVIHRYTTGGNDTLYGNPLNFTVTESANCEAHFWHDGGINNANTHRTIAVYPNPTNGRLTLDADDVQSVEVLDMMGRTVYTAKRTNQLDIQSLPNGAYLLRITLPDDVCVTKINKQ